MKNKAFLISFLLLSSFVVLAQDKAFRLGIRFAPSVSTNRITDVNENDSLDFETNGAGVRFSAGLSGDFYFSKRYAFHTGLWYTSSRSGVKYSGTRSFKGASGKSIHNLQYVQIPVAIKLYTDEIATDMKLYFVLGGTTSIKISEKEKQWSKSDGSGAGGKPDVQKAPSGKSYGFGDIGLLLGIGVEYQMGESTTLFGGISYNRGLLDIASRKGPLYFNGKDASDHYQVNVNLISLEAGIKF
jgi:hypothetical protein